MTFELSKEELNTVYSAITLPLVITTVRKNIDGLKTKQRLLNQLYVGVAELILKAIRDDLFKANVYLSKSNIKVMESDKNENELIYKVIFKGEDQIICISRDSLKKSISKRLGYYTRSLIPDAN